MAHRSTLNPDSGLLIDRIGSKRPATVGGLQTDDHEFSISRSMSEHMKDLEKRLRDRAIFADTNAWTTSEVIPLDDALSIVREYLSESTEITGTYPDTVFINEPVSGSISSEVGSISFGSEGMEQPKRGWVSVNDRLPEAGAPIWMTGNLKGCVAGTLHNPSFAGSPIWKYENGTNCSGVTHWCERRVFVDTPPPFPQSQNRHTEDEG